MGVLRRVAQVFLALESPRDRFTVDPERDTNRIRAIVDRSRHRGHRVIRVEEVWQELHDGLWGLHARPIGVNADAIAARGWVYARLLDLAVEGRLVEDPDDGGAHGRFWHTSTPVARMINASSAFREAMAMTREQLHDHGHDDLVATLRHAEHAMVRVKDVAQTYSSRTGIYPPGEVDVTGPHSHPPRATSAHG